MPSEAQIQHAYFYWLAINGKAYPDLFWIHHIPNGGERDKKSAYFMSQQGVRKGIWDIKIPIKREPFGGMYMEVKSEGGKLTPEQHEFGLFAHSQGYHLAVGYCLDDLVQSTIEYLKLDRATLIFPTLR